MKTYILLLLCFLFGTLYGQTQYDKYNWKSGETSPVADTIRSVQGAVVLMDKRINEVYLNQNDVFEEIVVVHRKIRLETAAAIDNYNKIYIPINNTLEIIKIKARFYSPGGKITELPQSSIKQVENLDNEGDFKTFAIEGAEAGGQLEYFYILRKEYSPYATIYMQDEIPKTGVEVLLCFPDKLEYFVKSYNGFPDFVKTKGKNEKTILKAAIDYIPGRGEEEYSNYKANLMRYDYTLAYNHYTGSMRTYSWSKACNNLYANNYVLEKSETKAVTKAIEKLNLAGLSEEAKIRRIENWMKSEIAIDEKFRTAQKLDEIMKSKQCSKVQAIRLLINLYQEAGVNFDLVLIGDNTNHPFDPDFNGFNFLEHQLIYFPGVDKYTVPEDDSYRLGLIPSYGQNSWGLFVKPVSTGELKTLGYEIRRVPGETPVFNTDSLLVNIRYDKDNSLLTLSTHRVFGGQNARTFQSFWHLIDNDRKKEVTTTMFDLGINDMEILSAKYSNTNPEDIGLKPFVWDVDQSARSLVEYAGDDMLVKIGETIGRQSELYKEEKRFFPIEIGTQRNYYRQLKFEIPEGYRVMNPENLNMDVKMEFEGRIGCFFKSVAKVEGNLLTVVVTECYNDPQYPVEYYESYRNVINAAADFNKKTLLLSLNK